MKRLLLIFTAVAALFSAGCETVSIDTTDNIASDEMIEICIVADAEGDDTRIALDGNTTRWEVGDCITLALTGAATNHYTLEIASADDITNNGKTARFTGSVAEGSYTQCTAIYPAIEDNTTSIISRHNEAVYMVAHHNEDVVIGSASASIPMSFRHLMHKLDYNLKLAAGYTDTDISKGVAIEMVARSNGEDFSLEQCRGFNIYTAYSDTASSSMSHIADFTTQNFIDKPIASALIFPATIPSAELEFNVYVEGRKVHTIIKSLNKDLTMSAGKTSKISLTLSAENKSKEAAGDSGGGGSNIEFNPDYLIKSWMYQGYSGISWGNYYTISGDNISMQVHFNQDVASEYSLAEGTYTKSTDSYVDDKTSDFRIRSASIGSASNVSVTDGTITVNKIGDNHLIIMELHVDTKSYNIGFYGPLSVENGGQTVSSGGTSSTKPDVTLSSLNLDSSANYPILKGSNSSGDAITIHVNGIDGITSGAYEHIARDYCQHKGYFNASDITIGGTHKSAKSGILYITKSSGSTTLHADITFNDGDTRHFKFDGKIEVPTVEGDLTLSASKSSIVGNGSDSVKFTVMQDGRDVTNECSIYINNAWHSSSFSSTTPGTYTVYATKGSKTSNTISITVTKYTPSSLTLSASKSTLKANGTDSVTFTVKADNNTTVTNLCEIYVNGVKQSGVTFSTYTAGNYSVYAKYNGVKSNTITLTATTVNSGKRVVFAEGVTLTSGWYDVNKKSTTSSAGADAMMCWAASSSNIIQWFQDRYTADGNTLPAGCPNGTSSKYDYELQIMDVFRDNWDNLARGNWTDGGVIWYFEGYDVYETNGQGSCAHPRLGTGGYFKSQWSNNFANMYKYDNGWYWYTHEPYTYATEINNYNWRGSSVADPLMKFSEYIVEAFEHGISSMAVAMSSNFGGAHAVTIWGYEIDNATGYVTKLYIADSDDGSTPVLQHYTVSPESGNSKIVLNGYNDYYPFALYPVSGYNSADK